VFVPRGDHNLMMHGLNEWLPIAAPAAGAPFLGVDRAIDRVRLAGISYDAAAAGVTLEEALINAASMISANGGKPDYCFMSFEDLRRVIAALGARVMYTEVPAQGSQGTLAKIGFQAVDIMGPKGVIHLVADDACPNCHAYMLQMDTWSLCSLGDAPRILTRNDKDYITVYNADSIEIRVGYYAELGCSAPGFNAHILLP
jgi:hypothetical protein